MLKNGKINFYIKNGYKITEKNIDNYKIGILEPKTNNELKLKIVKELINYCFKGR